MSQLSKKFNKHLLGSYLAGLIEGDGCFVVPAEMRGKNRPLSPFVKVCFHRNDYALAEKLKNVFGGRLVWNKTHTYVVWWIDKAEDLIHLSNFINGYLRTPKIQKFHELLTFLNNHWNQKFPLLGLDQSELSSNAWLTGITDADGHFSLNIYMRKGTNNLRVNPQYRLELKQGKEFDLNQQHSYFEICSKIAAFFKVSLYSRSRELNGKRFGMFRIVSHNDESRQRVVTYFETYPLGSSKYLNFKDWQFLWNMPKPRDKKRCLKIRENFNDKRKTFDWKHLENWKILNSMRFDS